MPEYWISINGQPGNQKALHTDEDCPKLQSAADYRPADRETHPHNDVCDVCAGEWSPRHDTDTYECDHCPATYETVGGLGRHVMREHPEVVEAQLKSDRRKVTA